MRYLAIAIALTGVVATAALAEGPAPTEALDISPAALFALNESEKGPLVIDVRTPAEYASGHIPGAVNIPFDQISQRTAEIVDRRGVALYCKGGPRARKGESALLAAGYEKVFHVEGGFSAWQAAGLPVERAQ